MPKLPDAFNSGVSVPQSSRGIIQAPSNPVLEVAAGIGQQIQAFADEVQNKENVRVTTEAITAFEDQQRQYLRTGENAVLNRQNANAKGVSKETNDWWDSKQKEFRSTLSNPMQQDAFDAYVSRQRGSVLDVVANHERTQMDSATTLSLSSRVESGIEHASVMYDQPDIVKQKRVEILDALDAMASVNGWDSVTKTARVEQEMNKFHIAQLAARIDTDPQGAQDYFNRNSGSLDARSRSAIQSQLNTGLIKLKSQQESDSILASTEDMKMQLSMAKEIKDPDLRDAVTQRLNQYNSNIESIERQSESDALDYGQKVLASGGSIQDIPVSIWHKTSGAGQLALQQIQNSKQSGKEIASGGVAYFELLKAAQDSPDEFVKVPFNQIAPFVSPSEREKLFKIHSDIKELGKAGSASVDDIIDRAAAGIGHDKKLLTDPSDDGNEVRAFYRDVDERIRLHEESTGKKAAPQDYERITDEMAINVLHRKSFYKFNVEKPAYLMTVDGVPPELVPKLAKLVREKLDSQGKSGDEVTVQLIKSEYIERQAEKAKNGQ